MLIFYKLIINIPYIFISGSYAEALRHYERGILTEWIQNDANGLILSNELQEHIRLCNTGIARTSIKNGDYRKGVRIFSINTYLIKFNELYITKHMLFQMKLAMEINDKQLYSECGDALQTIGHLLEAANLMEKAENWEQACTLYVQLKAWNKVHAILSNVTSTRVFGAYAQAKENEGNYMEAIENYKKSGDLDSCVRIYLDNLSDPHSASEIILESRSTEGAKLLAKYIYNYFIYFIIMRLNVC